MTLLVSWASSLQNGDISAVYIASDSRISAGQHSWDNGKKVFSCKRHPWIFGFCGDVLIPTQLLSQLVDSIDSEVLFSPDTSLAKKWLAIQELLTEGLRGASPFMSNDTSYILAFHRTEGAKFNCGYYTIYKGSVNFTRVDLNIKTSAIIKTLGTGAKRYVEIESKLRKNNSGNLVARIYFGAFCRTISETHVPTVGGAPQLGTLRTKGNGQLISVLRDGEIYFQGIKSKPSKHHDCFDKNFQRIDPSTRKLKNKAQRQPLK